MLAHEPPLTERELRAVRGMLDDYQYRLARQRVLGSLFGDFRVALAVCGGIMVFVLNAVTLIVLLLGGH